jgi:large subunit ribosomal protein L22
MNKRRTNKAEKSIERQKTIKCMMRNFRACPEKVRVMAGAVVGRQVETAKNILTLSVTKTSKLILNVLSSAIDIATSKKYSKDVDKLYVEKIMVDSGPTYKRIHPVSHGMAKHILKRTCHITVVVNDIDKKRNKK